MGTDWQTDRMLRSPSQGGGSGRGTGPCGGCHGILTGTVLRGPPWRAGWRWAAVPLGSTHSLGIARSSLPRAQSRTMPPPQLCSPRWELPTRTSTHHPTSPTPVPCREPPAPRGLPGTSERPPATRALGCSSRSFQRAGHTAGGLGTHQGCRQRGRPTPQHQHALAPHPSPQ